MNQTGSARWLLKPGERLNNTYQIDRALGHGGMGEVYLGHSLALDEDIVAIKVILPEKAKDENFRELFGREARALLRIRHPYIVGYRSFSHDLELDLHYIVTDFIEGENLAERIKRGPLDREEFRTLARALIEGLAAVHKAGIIHRDLAPDNVILEDGDVAHPKIIDFGVVKDTSGFFPTIVGDNIVGKMNFMAPEQLGKPKYDVGPWTDVYSLGLVLLAARRGEAADMGGSFADAIDKRQSPVDLTDLEAPTGEFLRRLLAPHPENRCQSMGEVLELLGAMSSDKTVAMIPAVTAETSKDLATTVPEAVAPPPEPAVPVAEAEPEPETPTERKRGMAPVAAVSLLLAVPLAAFATSEAAGWTSLLSAAGSEPGSTVLADAADEGGASNTDGKSSPLPFPTGSPQGSDGEGNLLSAEDLEKLKTPTPTPEPSPKPTATLSPKPIPVPSPTPTRAPDCKRANYIVFFDWDKSNITPEAASILDLVVRDFERCGGRAAIYLAGHTDREASASYNVGLSQRMADSVRSYLTGRGVSGGNISSEAFGETRNRVPTADGVRESQNRRVEITVVP